MLNICWLHILVSDIDSSRFSQWKHCLSSSFALCYIWNREYKSNKLTLKPSKKKLKNRSNFSGKKLIPDYAYLKWRGSNIVASRCKSIAKYWLDIWLHLRKQIFEIKIKISSLKFLVFVTSYPVSCQWLMNIIVILLVDNLIQSDKPKRLSNKYLVF